MPLLFALAKVLQVLLLQLPGPPFPAEDQNFARHHGPDFTAIEKGAGAQCTHGRARGEAWHAAGTPPARCRHYQPAGREEPVPNVVEGAA